ncbi:MAG: glycosyltransferase family 4 protein [Verrucomicrobia bacterium]|nr:glycosyltransferase family 4 protein [Verrucomicrobiota bacterium]
MPRVLYVLPQLPLDPSSGAARSTNTAAEFLAAAGWTVRALATTASETGEFLQPDTYLRSLGIEPHRNADEKTLRFTRRGIDYTLLDTGRHSFTRWDATSAGTAFDQLFDAALAEFQPDILYTYGGMPGDRRRHERARAAGCKIVFAVCNNNYHVPGFLNRMDAVTTVSEFHAASYRRSVGVDSTPLSSPLELEDVVAPQREPIFITMINPSLEKGVFFLARLAEELGVSRPDLPLLVIEARGTGGELVQAGLLGGFDLRRHENIMFSPAVPRPRDIYAATRVLLVPSVFDEPSGRVAAEALVNGIPPLVSERGGLPENCRDGGFVLPLPVEVNLTTRLPVSPAIVQPWINLIERLADDAEFYEAQSRRAREAGRYFHPESLAPRYVAFFERVLKTPRAASAEMR